MTIKLRNTRAIIDQLGGNAAVGNMLGATSKAVGNWRYANKFPAHTYLVLKRELTLQGYDAPDTLWAMTQTPVTPA